MIPPLSRPATTNGGRRVRSGRGQPPRAPHHHPRARGVHGALAGRRELRAARDAGVGRDRAARARGRRGAGLRGRPDRPRAGRRLDGGRRPARRQPGRLLEPGARARGPARALRGGTQHARGRRRRRARPRARARAAPGRPPRRRPRGRPHRPGQRRLGVDRQGGRDGDDRRCAAGRERRRRGRLRQRARRAREPRAPERARPPAHHGAVVGRRELAGPRGRARGRRVGGGARPGLPRWSPAPTR